jgi:hypothetical protein
MGATMNFGYASVDCTWFRSYTDNNYLMTLRVPRPIGGVLIARGVMDDYGTLVVVRDWL